MHVGVFCRASVKMRETTTPLVDFVPEQFGIECVRSFAFPRREHIELHSTSCVVHSGEKGSFDIDST